MACGLFWVAILLDAFLAFRVVNSLENFDLGNRVLLWVGLRSILWLALVYLIWKGVGPLRIAWIAINLIGVFMLFGTQWAMFRPHELLALVPAAIKVIGFLLIFLPGPNAWFKRMRRWSPG